MTGRHRFPELLSRAVSVVPQSGSGFAAGTYRLMSVAQPVLRLLRGIYSSQAHLQLDKIIAERLGD